MHSFISDRRGLNEVQLLNLETWRQYPKGDELCTSFLKQHHRGKLQITRQTPIASIGSCFSKEIKKWLIRNGYNFIETAQGPCTEAGSARYDRVYNTFSIRQEFERAFADFSPKEQYWEYIEGDQKILLDPYRNNVAWGDKAEMNAELAEHRHNVRKAFTEAQVLIITVGQAEIWFDKEEGAVFPLVPPTQVYDRNKHAYRLSTYEENLANLQRIHDLFSLNNPNGHMVITVSPVPLRATFRPVNSLVANTAGKAILRAAVDHFIQTNTDQVSYFPAYEVTMVAEHSPFMDDNRHVKKEVIEKIMNLFEDWYVK
jgi:hypothetical protein